MLRYTPKERISHQHCGGSLKSRTVFVTVVAEPLSTHTVPVYDHNNFQ
jgi:hypothetical protein